MTLLLFFGILILLLIMQMIIVVIHELGHFTIAKMTKMYVVEFSIGFGPKMFDIKKGDTIYSFRWLPFGGYVSVISDDILVQIKKVQEEVKDWETWDRVQKQFGTIDLKQDYNNIRTYDSVKSWKKVIFTFAGIFMNFVLAFVILFIMYISVGHYEKKTFSVEYYSSSSTVYETTDSSNQELTNTSAYSTDKAVAEYQTNEFLYISNANSMNLIDPTNPYVIDESPDFRLTNGNPWLVGIDQRPIQIDDKSTPTDQTDDILDMSPLLTDQEANLVTDPIEMINLMENAEEDSYYLFYFYDIDHPNNPFYRVLQKDNGKFGVNSYPAYWLVMENLTFFESIWFAFRDTLYYSVALFWQIFQGIWIIFGGTSYDLRPTDGTNDTFFYGYNYAYNTFFYTAYFSATLGFMNFIPIPPLDGYKTAEVLYESTTKKKVSLEKSMKVNRIGWIVVIFGSLFIVFLPQLAFLPLV